MKVLKLEKIWNDIKDLAIFLITLGVPTASIYYYLIEIQQVGRHCIKRESYFDSGLWKFKCLEYGTYTSMKAFSLMIALIASFTLLVVIVTAKERYTEELDLENQSKLEDFSEQQ